MGPEKVAYASSRAVLAYASDEPDSTEALLRDWLGCRTATSHPAQMYLGNLFERQDQADSAIAMYTDYIQNGWEGRISHDGLWLALAHRRLASLYAQRGDSTKAIEYYANFLDLWEDADADLQPQVQEAQQNLARLMVAN